MPPYLVLAFVLALTAGTLASEDVSEGCLAGEDDFCRTNDACQSFYNRTCFEHRKGKPKICKDLRKCIEETFLNFDSNLRNGQRQFGNMSVCSKLDVLTAYCNTEGCKKTYDQQCFDQVVGNSAACNEVRKCMSDLKKVHEDEEYEKSNPSHGGDHHHDKHSSSNSIVLSMALTYLSLSCLSYFR